MDRRDAAHVYFGPARRAARDRLRCALRLRAHVRPRGIAHAERIARPRRTVATLPNGGFVVSLACVGTARLNTGMFAAFLATFCFSVSVVCGHRTAKLIGGIEANFWRLALATFFLGIWTFTGGTGLAGGALPIFLLSGLIGIGIGDAGLFEALPRLGSRLSVLLIQCGTAPIAALVEWLWLGTTLGAVQILCVVVILAGVAGALSPSEHLHIPRAKLWAGILFALLGAAGNGIGAVTSRKGYAIASANGEPMDGGTAAFQRLLGGLLIAG